MTPKIYFLISIVVFLVACSNKTTRPTTSLDTGRAFIKASLNGDFATAESLLSADSQNIQLFTAYKDYYSRMPDDKKQHYKNASYEINKFDDINDSTVIINYSNDYMNKPMSIKIIRVNGIWSVDFKYVYSGNLPIN